MTETKTREKAKKQETQARNRKQKAYYRLILNVNCERKTIVPQFSRRQTRQEK